MILDLLKCLKLVLLRDIHFPGLPPKQLIALTDVFLAVLSKNIMNVNKCCIIDTNIEANLLYKSRVR